MHPLARWLGRVRWSRKLLYPLAWRALLPLVVLALLLQVQFRDPSFRARLRDQSFDQLQKRYPGAYSDDIPVRVVAIDDASLAAVGQWPWPRTVLAQVIDQLTALGANVVVLDMLLAEADRTSPEQVRQFWPQDPRLDAVLAHYPAHDHLLAASFARSRVVAGVAANNHTPPQRLAPPQALMQSVGGDARDWLLGWTGGLAYLPPLAQAARGSGVVTIVPDQDGILRSMPLLSLVGDELFPSLGLEALRLYLGADAVRARVLSPKAAGWTQRAGIAGLELGSEAFLPTSRDARIWLHARPYQSARYVSAIDVLRGKVDPRSIKDHMVFIGATSVGLGDVVRTPFGEVVPGLEGHVQLVEQLLTHEYLLRPDWENSGFTLLLLAYGAALALMLSVLRPVWSVALMVAAIAGLFALSAWLFQRHYLLLDPIFPALGVLALFLSMAVPRYLYTEREQRWIRTAFSRYVSPNRVKFLQEHPETLSLGGEYRECSFVMTDLAGFTSMMEKYEPAMLSALLNEYLNGMIETAFAHEGTLDRIVGDAVAVMFSAPVEQADHAARAVACALAMDRFAHAFSQKQQQLGIPFGKTRIGVNTGLVMVGNFGGKVMLDYRALGDAINTAARLETLNNHLGTRISVSESSVSQCPGFHGRPAGRLVLKGKKNAITVYEPLTEDAALSERVQQYRDAYALMDANAPAAASAFEQLHARYPDDPLVTYHALRLAGGASGSLVVMSSK